MLKMADFFLGGGHLSDQVFFFGGYRANAKAKPM